jgi:predicted enzyme involved in methoxymalonyl-ACP biosynthesis
MNIAVEAARRRGVREFLASYIPTKKNTVISDLYPSLGFVPCPDSASQNGATRWKLNLPAYVKRNTHIEHSGAQNG